MKSSSGDSHQEPVVIHYKYDGSPFARKVELLLTARRIPHFVVRVSPIPPRPELELLGIDYRRIPVLAINDTVYCDTFKIAEAIESIYPDSEDHPSLYPSPFSVSASVGSLDQNQKNLIKHNEALQKISTQFWTDRALFQLCIRFASWNQVPEAFLKDREKFIGQSIDPDEMEKDLPHAISELKAQLDPLYGLLSLDADNYKNNKFIFSGSADRPSFLDLSIYTMLEFVLQHDKSDLVREHLFGSPNSLHSQRLGKWMKDVAEFYHNNKIHSQQTVISAEEANEKIGDGGTIPNDLKSVTHEESLYGLGTEVSVVPDDTGKVPTTGILINVDSNSILLLVKRRGSGNSKGTCKVCFPRLGFKIFRKGFQVGKL